MDRAFTMMYIAPASLYAWSVCSPLDSIGIFCDYAVNVAGFWLALFFQHTICIAAASVVLEGAAKKYDVGKYDVGKLYIFVRRILYFALTFGITCFLVEKCGIIITM